MSRRWSYPLIIPAIALVYFAAAKLGLSMAFVARQVTAVWPPTGIALAAVLLLGYRVWPGILLGAFLANVTVHESPGVACAIATGNTLEALAGAWMLQRLAGFSTSLNRLRDVLALLIGAAAVSTLVSATIGTSALCLRSIQPWSRYFSVWSVWWLGDAMGDLLIAPLLLTWAGSPRVRPGANRLLEAGALVAVVTAVGLAIFRAGLGRAINHHPLEYLIFPCVIWAALRFGQRGTSAVVVIAACIAVWGTVSGLGPFAAAGVNDRLVLLLLFLGVTACSALLLGAAIAERVRAEQALREADQRKDEFLAMLSHELRNPLAPIINAAEVLRLQGPDHPVLNRQREVIARQASHMARLVEDLLDVARITRGQIELRREPLDLGTVVEQAVDSCRPLIEQRRHELALSLPSYPVHLLGDAVRLHQAFVNLLNNATRYTETGGRISVELRCEAETAVLRVTDTGDGISSDLLPHIFSPFVQGDRTLARTEGGLGIGLAVVKRLAEMHGGSVSAHSAGHGLGSDFVVRLPLLKPDAGPPAGTAASSPGEGGSVPVPAPPARR